MKQQPGGLWRRMVDLRDGSAVTDSGSQVPTAARADDVDDESLAPIGIKGVKLVEDVIHYVVAALLLAVAGYVLFHTVEEFLGHSESFAHRVTSAVNGVLFVIIVLEILRTVISHFDQSEFQLKPFLIIGIISAVRHILTVNAQTSLGGHEGDAEHFRRTLWELGINSAVVLALVIGLVLVRRSERQHHQQAGPEYLAAAGGGAVERPQ